MVKKRFILVKLFGDYARIRIIETLLNEYFENNRNFLKDDVPINEGWMNITSIAKRSGVSKSTSKKILEEFLESGFILEKEYVTHAQFPPRYFRLNPENYVIRELLFFYEKIRGFL